MECVQPPLDEIWHFVQSIAVALQLGLGNLSALHRQIQCDHEHRYNLASEGLRRGNPNLGPSVQVDTSVRQPCDAGTDNVHYAYSKSLKLLSDPDGLKCVSSFTTLRDGNHNVLRGYDRPTIAELACVFHFHRQPRQALQSIFSNEPRVEGRPTSDYDDPVSLGHTFYRRPLIAAILGDLLQATKLQSPAAVATSVICRLVQSATQCIPDCVWLVHNLLEHEVLVASLLYLFQ
mmetsp:Transcript_34968/g.67396  ORF Transcript_34968/g.67396 Transcript_34968/m.67396 type:complete len:233 (+) Transcript_34968:537-1235(+)